jgi:hypothetical protein
MNRDDVTRMAREAGLHIATDVNWMPIIGLEYAERFASLVASAEREVCAQMCDDLDDDLPDGLAGWQYGEAIRARGQA